MPGASGVLSVTGLCELHYFLAHAAHDAIASDGGGQKLMPERVQRYERRSTTQQKTTR